MRRRTTKTYRKPYIKFSKKQRHKKQNNKPYRHKKRTNKIKKSIRTKKYKLGGTGVLINNGSDSAEEQFMFFIKNSKLRLLAGGANGIAVLATLNDGINSPYSSMDSSSYGNPINKIVIKFVIISVIPEEITLLGGGRTLSSTLLSSVIEEVNIQTIVALKTMNYLEPISPCPLYFNGKFSYDSINNIIKPNLIQDGSRGQELLKQCLNDMLNFIDPGMNTSESRSISVIGMEYADGYEGLWSLESSSSYNNYIYMVMYLLIKLAVETEYFHGDYHKGNIMINPTKTGYFDGMQGAPLLIDYGLSRKIEPDKMVKIRELFNAEIRKDPLQPDKLVIRDKYTQIIDILSDIPRKDGQMLMDIPESYGYIQEIIINPVTNALVNLRIDKLFKDRDEAIKKTQRQFEDLHRTDPSRFPLLPLPNNIKNKMYSGVVFDNEIIIPSFEFDESKLRQIRDLFNWLYDFFMIEYDGFYSLSQRRCFYIVTCYNFIYIVNNPPANSFINKEIKMYALIASLFVDCFNIENNKDGRNLFDLVRYATNNIVTNKTFFIHRVNQIYRLFDYKKVNADYAPIFANKYDSKEDFVELMLNPITYTNPSSLLHLVGPRVRQDVENYEFPYGDDV